MVESFVQARSSLFELYHQLKDNTPHKRKVGRAVIDLDRCIKIIENEKENKFILAIRKAFGLKVD